MQVSRTLRAGAVAAVLSGAPSTAYALAAGRDPLEATLAAGSLVLPRETRRGPLLAAAVPVHLGLSLGWAVVLDRAGVRGARAGALAGLAIAALDLGVVGRRFPRIRALPLVPQLADHVAFGAIAGRLLGTRVSPWGDGYTYCTPQRRDRWRASDRSRPQSTFGHSASRRSTR